MAGRLYRMAKVVSANPASWGIVDANQISGFRTVATQADLYSIAACILSSSYGDGTTTGADAIGQIWHVQEGNGGKGKDFRLTSWASRGTSAGWTEVLYADSVYSKSEIDGKISTINKNINTVGNAADAASVAASAAQTTANAAKSQATANATAIAGKADKTDLANFKALKGQANGLATLDGNKRIPLEQLGNLDTTLFEVVSELPSTIATIKKHIYLKTAETTGTKNNYAEYIYTGDLTSTATYDATKWEKLGEVSAEIDMSGYATTIYVQNAVGTAKHDVKPDTVNFTKHTGTTDLDIDIKNSDGTKLTKPVSIPLVNIDNNTNGLMSPTMLTKLNGLNNYTHPSHTGAKEGLYKITVDNLGHVSKATPVEKDDITGLGIPGGIPALTAEVTMTPGTNTIHFVHGDNTPDVVLKTATTTEAGLCSAAMFNKLGSLNVVDVPEYDSNDLVTGDGIINAIDTHIIDDANLGSFDASKTGTYTITGLDTGNSNQLTSLTDSLTYTFDPSGNSTLRIDTGAVWTDLTLKAITNDELTEILR